MYNFNFLTILSIPVTVSFINDLRRAAQFLNDQNVRSQVEQNVIVARGQDKCHARAFGKLVHVVGNHSSGNTVETRAELICEDESLSCCQCHG